MSETRQRLDKWLWFARCVKTRTLAAKLVAAGHVRVNGERTDQASKAVKPGDVLTIALERTVKVWRVIDVAERRGPAPEAQTLYDDLSPGPPPREALARVGARPTKKDRRATEAWQSLGDE